MAYSRILASLLVLVAGSLALTACSAGGSPECSAAMKAAADVVELDNNAELMETLKVCASADDWIETLKGNPGAGALISYTTADAENLLDLSCVKAITTPVCVDASAAGILTYELDDPAVIELNQ